ncbi:MAG: hypothetical protein WDO19_24410 [Bacteroidota bacterium]
MKKIEFSLEVLILLGIIPFYVFLEMNHRPKQIAETNTNTIPGMQARQDRITEKSFINYQLKPAS